jgi:mannose-6-phosphate isomerase-like protein (cupin superfamily)
MATTEQRPLKSQVNTTWEELDFLDTMLGNAALFDIGDPDNEHRPAVVMVEYAPGAQVPPHHHGCDYLSYVIAGELEVTRVTHGPGSIRVVRAGTAYGPLRAGPEGARVLEVFADRANLMATFLGDSELAQQYRAEQERRLAEILASAGEGTSATSEAAGR